MSDFTFEYRESKENCLSIYEKYEWDNVWIEYANTANKRRIAYIGDSINNPDKYVADGIHLSSELYETLADEIILNVK